MGDAFRARLPAPVEDAAMFVLKHLWAGVYGGILLVAIALSAAIWQPDWPIARYDALLLVAVAVQLAFIALRIESRDELVGLVVFCLLGMGLEWFNTARGHWTYPEEGLFAIGHVPLFVGFAYAAVGICLLRMLRIFDMCFAPFPPRWVMALLALAIYVNFFTQHLWVDIRLGLFAATLALFARTRIHFDLTKRRRGWMPMLLSLVLSALCLWLAENLGTLTDTWEYHGQGDTVSLATLGSWYLFLCVALMVALLVMPGLTSRSARDEKAKPR